MTRKRFAISVVLFSFSLAGLQTHAFAPMLVNGHTVKKISKNGEPHHFPNTNVRNLDNVILIQDVTPKESDKGRMYIRPNTCTATLVGPNTILTAAHCVEPYPDTQTPRSSIFLVNREDNLQAEFRCSLHRQYKNTDFPDVYFDNGQVYNTEIRSSFDLALCFSSTFQGGSSYFRSRHKKEVLGVTYFAKKSRVYERPKVNAGLTLSGYGCHGEMLETIKGRTIINNGKARLLANAFKVKTYKTREEKARKDFHLKYGNVKISSFEKQKKFILGRFNSNAFGTATSFYKAADSLNDVKVCSGDSGGPAFSNFNSVHRRVSGIISASASPVSENDRTVEYHNKFVDLNHIGVNEFINLFLTENPRAEICGVTIPFGSGPKSVCRK